MKVVMFSTDPAVFKEGAPAYERMKEYKQLFDELHIIVVTNLVSLARSFFVSARIVKKNPLDFIVSSQEEFTGLIAFLLKLRYGVLWQAQVHTDIFSPYYKKVFFKNRIRVLVARATLPHANGFRVVSERIKKSLIARGISAPIAILPIYTNLDAFRSIRAERRDSRFHIVIISRLTREKNIKLALRAFSQFAKKYRDAGLIIVGDGPERRRLERERSRLGLLGRVQFEGWREDSKPYLANADCSLATSWYEGYGLSVVEAMAAGVSVLVSNAGIAGEILKDGVSGLVFEPGDEKKLTALLEKVYTDVSLRSALGSEAQKAIAALPSKEEYLDMFKKSFDICKN